MQLIEKSKKLHSSKMLPTNFDFDCYISCIIHKKNVDTLNGCTS